MLRVTTSFRVTNASVCGLEYILLFIQTFRICTRDGRGFIRGRDEGNLFLSLSLSLRRIKIF